jgi:2-methylisocitrate lyase-like PEP mutase family enzyme
MSHQADLARWFAQLHHGEQPLLLPNPWDVGSARLLASLGFQALATTSSGFAATLGRLDGAVTREEALAHAAALAAATDLPLSADLENGFADEPAGVAETVRLAIEAGLAGCSIEDHTGDDADPIYAFDAAVARVAAAAEAAHAGPVRRVVAEAGRPVNVLGLPDVPQVHELAEAGVARISVGGGFAFAAIAAVGDAARELQGDGTYAYFARTREGSALAKRAFG